MKKPSKKRAPPKRPVKKRPERRSQHRVHADDLWTHAFREVVRAEGTLDNDPEMSTHWQGCEETHPGCRITVLSPLGEQERKWWLEEPKLSKRQKELIAADWGNRFEASAGLLDPRYRPPPPRENGAWHAPTFWEKLVAWWRK